MIAGRVESRHFGGLAADQRAAGFLAAFRNAADHRLRHAKVELPGREIVEKEQGLCTLHHKVVDVHGHKVDADPGIDARLDGELELGAHSIGGGDQYGIFEAARLEIEQAAKSANRAKYALALGPSCKGGNGFDQRVARVDIDASVAIGHAGLVLGGCGHRNELGVQVQAIWHNNRALTGPSRVRHIAVFLPNAESQAAGPASCNKIIWRSGEQGSGLAQKVGRRLSCLRSSLRASPARPSKRPKASTPSPRSRSTLRPRTPWRRGTQAWPSQSSGRS